MEIRPIELSGDWNAGFALDEHTVSSKFLGYDENGHEVFDTKYSEVGDLLKRLKYKSDKSVARVLAYTGARFVEDQKWPVDIVVPVPPSRVERIFQPLLLLADYVSEFLKIPVCKHCIVKAKNTPELKNVLDFNERLQFLDGAYSVSTPDVAGRTVLLLDDLYRSGATAQAVVKSLNENGQVKKIFFLAFAKTRVKR